MADERHLMEVFLDLSPNEPKTPHSRRMFMEHRRRIFEEHAEEVVDRVWDLQGRMSDDPSLSERRIA